jgi:hypothetical protein
MPEQKPEDKRLDQILQAIPWRCFHCDFVTSDPEKAEAHFGDGDDASEFVPVCRWWANSEDDERKRDYQDLLMELKRGADENTRLSEDNDRLREETQGGGCQLAGPGRGDCEHFVGLPGRSVPNMHDGPDDTVDVYGKPNGWCWSCWKSNQLAELRATLAALTLMREMQP